MFESLNKVILIGYVDRKPKIRETRFSNRIARFRLVTSENWQRKKSGKIHQHFEWHPIIIYNQKLIEFVEQYLNKGSKVYVEGQLGSFKWRDNSGMGRCTRVITLQKYSGELRLLDGNSFNSEISGSSNANLDKIYETISDSGSASLNEDISF